MYHSPSVVTLQIPSAPPAKFIEYRGSRGRQLALILLGVCNVFFWVLCTTIQAMILIKFHSPAPLTSNKLRLALVDLDYDTASSGIWGSLLYGCAGLLVICTAYEERKCMFVLTLIVSIWSLFSSLVIITFSGMTTLSLSHSLLSSQIPLWLFLECCLMVVAALSFMINLAIIITVAVVICKPSPDLPQAEPRNNPTFPTPQPHETASTAQQFGMTLCPPPFHYPHSSPYPVGHNPSPIPPYETDDRHTTPRVMLAKNSIM